MCHHAVRVSVGLACLLGVVGHARGETIGSFTVDGAPSSAQLVGGGGAPGNWLNVANAAVSINEAFTGFSIVADGYGNVPAGTTLLLTFDFDVLRNRPGADFVLFDATNDSDIYRIRTNYDNFAQERIFLPTDFMDTGEDRSYFFGGAGPTSRDVMAAAIDLSLWNIPEGASVTQLRVFTEGGANDPLGVGVLNAGVPAMSQWGFVVLALLVGAAGTVVAMRNRWTAVKAAI